jgi:hypothetical protein
MTPLSAAMTIVRWTEEHGREPRDQDCRGSGGLLWASTYYRRLEVSTFSAAIQRSFELASGANVFATEPKRKTKKCLGYENCGKTILDEGHAIRFCAQCRKRQANEESEIDLDYFQPRMSRGDMERYGVGRDGWIADLASWDE